MDDQWNFSFPELPPLNLDIWKKIVGNLNLFDLTNLADVCTVARQAARLIFERKYASKEFYLRIDRKEMEILAACWDENHDNHGLVGHKRPISFKFLRNFGDLISELDIWMLDRSIKNGNRLRQFINHINKFSAQSRKTLEINKHLSVLIETPLNNLNEIKMNAAEYSVDEFSTLIKNVPNLKLCSGCAHIYLNQNMPQVKKLEISTTNKTGEISDENVLQAMQLNPQIEQFIINQPQFKIALNGTSIDLEISKNYRARLFKLIRSEQYERMFLNYWSYTSYFNLVDFVKEFKRLKCLSFVYYGGKIDEVIVGMRNLEELKICVYSEIEMKNLVHILTSAVAHGRLLVLSFHFDRLDKREKFQTKYKQLITLGPWSSASDEDGPKEYKYSFVLNWT